MNLTTFGPYALNVRTNISSYGPRAWLSEFDTKYHVLHNFITSTPFEEKSSDHFKDLHKMEPLTNFDISLTSFLGGVMN